MRIALDYDGTYSADPRLWEEFITSVNKFGHSIYIVTMRCPNEHPIIESLFRNHLSVTNIIYTSKLAKKLYVDKLGIPMDIWIDDSPHFVNSDAPDAHLWQ